MYYNCFHYNIGTSIHCTRERRSLIPNRQSPIDNRRERVRERERERQVIATPLSVSPSISNPVRLPVSRCLPLSPSISNHNFKFRLLIRLLLLVAVYNFKVSTDFNFDNHNSHTRSLDYTQFYRSTSAICCWIMLKTSFNFKSWCFNFKSRSILQFQFHQVIATCCCLQLNLRTEIDVSNMKLRLLSTEFDVYNLMKFLFH